MFAYLHNLGEWPMFKNCIRLEIKNTGGWQTLSWCWTVSRWSLLTANWAFSWQLSASNDVARSSSSRPKHWYFCSSTSVSDKSWRSCALDASLSTCNSSISSNVSNILHSQTLTKCKSTLMDTGHNQKQWNYDRATSVWNALLVTSGLKYTTHKFHC